MKMFVQGIFHSPTNAKHVLCFVVFFAFRRWSHHQHKTHSSVCTPWGKPRSLAQSLDLESHAERGVRAAWRGSCCCCTGFCLRMQGHLADGSAFSTSSNGRGRFFWQGPKTKATFEGFGAIQMKRERTISGLRRMAA